MIRGVWHCISYARQCIASCRPMLLSASTDPVPDIVAKAVTPGSPLIVDLPGVTGAGVFAAAAVNVGLAGTITAMADTGAAR